LSERRAEALREFQEAVRLQADFDEPHYYLGICYRMQKDFANARQEFENALRINPLNSQAHGNLGLIFMEQGSLALAEAHFRSALRINPDDPLARESLEQLSRLTAARERSRPKN
jgi:Flp pilus assembly protein TadD